MSSNEVILQKLLERIERVLALAGERWLEPDTGDEFIRAEWRPEGADEAAVCFSRRDRDGAVIVLNPVDLPYCRISASGAVDPRSDEALEQVLAWLEEFEATLERR